MIFPRSERVLFEKRPLKEVICQLRFPPILEIASEKPAQFQNKIRDTYPLYEVEQASFPKELAEFAAQIPIGALPSTPTHKFISEDGSRFLSLNPEFVAFSDSAYRRWEAFQEQITTARQTLEEVYRPAFYSRIGLRYQNVIDKIGLGLGNVPWGELVRPPVGGLLGSDMGSYVVSNKTVASISLESEIPGAIATVRHGVGRTADEKEVYFVDLDCFTTERRKGPDVDDILRRFNRLCGDFFRWAITPRLSDALDPRKL